MSDDDLVDRARRYAETAHGAIDHRRKYSGRPYVEHLERVARRVAAVTDDPLAIAAAWLHDVVEDTPATLHDIEREFGSAVAQLVAALTDVGPECGNRDSRKAIDRDRLAHAPAAAQTVKLADLLDNADDIAQHDRHFSRVYLREMRALVGVLTRGNAALRAEVEGFLARPAGAGRRG